MKLTKLFVFSEKITFGLNGKELYTFSSEDPNSFITYYNFGEDEVDNFAVGNNELFYTTKKDG